MACLCGVVLCPGCSRSADLSQSLRRLEEAFSGRVELRRVYAPPPEAEEEALLVVLNGCCSRCGTRRLREAAPERRITAEISGPADVPQALNSLERALRSGAGPLKPVNR